MRQPYEDLIFMTPLSAQRAETFVRFVADGLRGPGLDIGCAHGVLGMAYLALLGV